jgi:GrpB-like predicted nucleotidyltransferase (UPF0157 family)
MDRDQDPVHIQDYDATWPSQFGRLAARIVGSLELRHHLYVLVEGATELRRHIAFRDALRRRWMLVRDYPLTRRLL